MLVVIINFAESTSCEKSFFKPASNSTLRLFSLTKFFHPT